MAKVQNGVERNIAENFNRLRRAHEHYRQQTARETIEIDNRR